MKNMKYISILNFRETQIHGNLYVVKDRRRLLITNLISLTTTELCIIYLKKLISICCHTRER